MSTLETPPTSVRPPDTSTGPLRFLGRQPILDAKLNLYGYELLFRAGLANVFSGDPEVASNQVIDNCLTLVPETEQVTAFVNCTRDVLVSGVTTLLPPGSTVLEILENIAPDPEVLESCRALKSRGYRFALDDFSPDTTRLPFFEFADFVKVDFRASSADVRRDIYAMAAHSKANLVAEKIETTAEFDIARAEGCTLFQGYFFAKPHIISARAIPQCHLVYLQLLAALNRESPNITQIEKIISSDASLCYRLLRLVNSALYALPTGITSIRAALIMVGTNELRKLVIVALASAFATGNSKTLVSMALARARFCELLAPSMQEDPSKLYLLGMLSMLDAILKIPMPQILDSLPLEHDMKAALVGERSGVGAALDLVRAHEAGDWDRCEFLDAKLSLLESAASRLYVNSIQWADSVLRP